MSASRRSRGISAGCFLAAGMLSSSSVRYAAAASASSFDWYSWAMAGAATKTRNSSPNVRSIAFPPHSASSVVESAIAPAPTSVSRDRRGDRRGTAQGLQHDAIALGQSQQRVEPLLRLVGVERKAEADLAEADRGGALDTKRAAEIEIALGADLTTAQAKFERGRHCLQGDAGAGHQRLQQHV